MTFRQRTRKGTFLCAPKGIFVLSKAMQNVLSRAVWLMVLSLGGCLRLIEVDVPTDTGELVVEAYYNDSDSAVVRLSRTVPYFKEGRPAPIQNALVYLEEVETGARDTLVWRDSMYVRVGGQVQPASRHTYRLYVRTADGEEAQAICRMPEPVRLETLFVLFRPANGFLPEGLRAIGAARDPAGFGNAYRARLWINDTLQNRIRDWIYSDDRYVDGNYVVFEFPYNLNPGDTLAVELMSIPNEVIQYYDQLLRNASGSSGGFSPPPDNAYSNFTGNRRRVWGFFIAYASDRKGVRAR